MAADAGADGAPGEGATVIVPCDRLPGLSGGQVRLCQLYGDHMLPVATGAQQAVKECQYQFRHRRWNCSTVEDNTVFGPITKICKLLQLFSNYSNISTCNKHI